MLVLAADRNVEHYYTLVLTNNGKKVFVFYGLPSSVGWLVGWLGGWVVGWLVGWLVGWPAFYCTSSRGHFDCGALQLGDHALCAVDAAKDTCVPGSLYRGRCANALGLGLGLGSYARMR